MTIKINYGKIYLSSVTWEIGVIKVRKKIVFLVITFMFIFSFSFKVNASVIDNNSVLASSSLSGDIVRNVMPMVEDCETLLGSFEDDESPAHWISWGLDLMRYIAVIALLALVTMDFLKAIASNDKDALKKAGSTSIKRFIYCVLIFFIPVVVKFIMELFGIAGSCMV